MGAYDRAAGKYLLETGMNIDAADGKRTIQKLQMSRAQSQADSIRGHLEDHERGLGPLQTEADHGPHDMNIPSE